MPQYRRLNPLSTFHRNVLINSFLSLYILTRALSLFLPATAPCPDPPPPRRRPAAGCTSGAVMGWVCRLSFRVAFSFGLFIKNETSAPRFLFSASYKPSTLHS